MKKSIFFLLAGGLAMILMTSSALGWGSATHTYIAHYLNEASGKWDLDEIYGSIAPDIFNYAFQLPPVVYSFLHEQTHDNFMLLWNSVPQGSEKPMRHIAYGFVSHNDVWGADSTAHHASMTLLPNEGYIITKATQLDQLLLMYVPEYGMLGLPDSVRMELCHNVAEAAGDILIRREDPMIGKKIMDSAARASGLLKNLLLKAYKNGLAMYVGTDAATEIILGAEAAFRNSMVAYGFALLQDEATAIDLIAQDFQNMAAAYLASLGVSLPPGTNLYPLIMAAMNLSLQLMETDYTAEIEATLTMVEQELENHLDLD